ncbi:MAG TPA: Zn-ribbon domain-containing OB-fold protein [Actinomycetota bacterium]
MREKIAKPDEVRRWPGEFPVGHHYTPGVAGEAFFTALRDRGAILGSRCEACSYTYVPARLFCERCFAELAADVEVGPEGTLVSFTIGFVGVEGEPLDRPVTLGLVRLDGTDAVLLHHVLDPAEEPLEIGERVQVVVRPERERTGSILDIEGFRPAADESD